MIHDEPKRRRTESIIVKDEVPSTGEVVRDNELWLEDGNIVLVARNVAFRIYRGVLVTESPVFRDMLKVPQSVNLGTIDGCLVVNVSDSPEDLRNLLRVLYKNRKYVVDILDRLIPSLC